MRTLIFLTLFTAQGLAFAHPHPRIELAEQALAGNAEAIERYLELCDDRAAEFFIVGQAFLAAGNVGRALEMLEVSARKGYRPALWAIAQHHVDSHDWDHGYAWGRLSMLVAQHDADGEIAEDEWPMQWSWQLTQRAARNLRENEFPDADAMTERVAAEWYPILTADHDEPETASFPRFVRRGPPTYPREFLQSREAGWSVVLLDFEPEGSVRRVVPVGESHREFADHAMRAIEDWAVDPRSVDDWAPESARLQIIEFNLEN